MNKHLLFATALFFLLANSFSLKATDEFSIPLKNTLAFNRTNELTEVTVAGVSSFSNLALFDESGNPVAYQVISTGKIAFPVTINALSAITYMLKTGVPAITGSKTYAAQKVPTTRNDIAWENDLSAYRMYCKLLLATEPNTANGNDVWCKKQATSMIDKMYTYANYHAEQTEGVDCYSVNGKTLGAGGVVAYVNSQLWLHNPYDTCKIISNGPLQSEFILIYTNVLIDGDLYTKTVRITSNANGLLNKAVVKFEGRVKPMKIASGIYLHTNMSGITPAGIQYTSESNLIGYAENPSEGSVTTPNPRIYTGVLMPGESTFSTINNQLVIMSDYAVGSEFTYYFGAGWNAFPVGKYSVDTDWFNALNQFKQTTLNPIIFDSISTLPSKTEVIKAGVKVNNLWIANNTDPGNNLWARSVYNIGNIDFYKVYPDKSYKNYAELWATKNSWLVSGAPSTANADNNTCGQVYLDLYTMDTVKDLTKINSIKSTLDYGITNYPKSADWWWIDAMFMAMPTYSKLSTIYNDAKYNNKAHAMYANIRDTLVVSSGNTNLWPASYRTTYGVGPIVTCSTCGNQSDGLYNAVDSLWFRDWGFQPNTPPKKDPNNSFLTDVPKQSPNGKNIYWARGNGWVIAAMVRTLQSLPIDNEHRPEYVAMLRQMAGALKSRQRVDGFWNMNLADPNHNSGVETSGTAFFTYGIAWGINNGILDKVTYLPIVAKAWKGLTTIAVQTSGNLKYTQNVGEGPILPASLSSSSVDFGVGAFLLATSEVVKLADGNMPQVPVRTVNLTSAQLQDSIHILATFDEELDVASATEITNYTINGTVLNGSVAIATTKSVRLTLNSRLDYGRYTFSVEKVLSKDGFPVVVGANKLILRTVPLTVCNPMLTITAIGNQIGNTPENSLDNNISTRWSQAGLNQWIKYDLGKVANVWAIDLAFYLGDQRTSYFDIQLSTDNSIFNTVISGGQSSGLTTELERFGLTSQQARYIRIMCKGNSTGGENWNSITETRIRYTNLTDIVSPCLNSKRLVVAPNPIKGNCLELFSNEALPSNVEIQIFDIIGNLVAKRQVSSVENRAVVNNLNLSQGYYILNVGSDAARKSTTFIVK